MAWKINQLSVDLLSDKAHVTMHDEQAGAYVSLQVKITTPGNQPENRLKEIAKEAARKALQDALAAL